MKKILHVVLSLDIGGLEKVLVNCVNQLNSSDYKHEIIALKGCSYSFKALLPSNINVTSFDKREGNDLSVYRKFFQYLRKNKPDVVQTYNLSTLELQVIAFLCRVKTRIHAEHGRDIFDPEGKNKKYILLRKLVFTVTHHIVAVSNDLYQWLLKVVDVPAHKALLVVNGVDTSHFKPRLRQSQNNILTFGHVGRLAEIKNQQLLIESFSLACEISDNFDKQAQLLIVGEGPCKQQLVKLIEKHKLSDSIHLLGAKIDMLSEYHKLDVFLMSSLAEGIPMTLLESMSCGLVPVVTKVGGIPEVVSHENGILYESEDAEALANILIHLIEDPELVNKLGNSARKTIVERFSEKAMVQAYDSLYQGAKQK